MRITLDEHERDALRALPDTLAPVLSGDATGDLARAVHERLFPRAYDDPDHEQEYRSLVRADLVAERRRALAAFTDSLDAGASTGRTWTLELDTEAAQLWLAVVNDARLALGAVLGVTSEEQWEEEPDPGNPASMLLWYLGWLEQGLVEALARDLPA